MYELYPRRFLYTFFICILQATVQNLPFHFFYCSGLLFSWWKIKLQIVQLIALRVRIYAYTTTIPYIHKKSKLILRKIKYQTWKYTQTTGMERVFPFTLCTTWRETITWSHQSFCSDLLYAYIHRRIRHCMYVKQAIFFLRSSSFILSTFLAIMRRECNTIVVVVFFFMGYQSTTNCITEYWLSKINNKWI